MRLSLFFVFVVCGFARGLQSPEFSGVSRRAVILSSPSAALFLLPAASNAAKTPNGLALTTSSSGIRWADAKVGNGQPLKSGASASIDYSMASVNGRFPLIYSTKDTGTPYRWTLGDGTTIKGIELALLGDGDEIPPMLPGGIRRVIVPAKLGYEPLVVGQSNNAKCVDGAEGSVGPIPPKNSADGAYQRWYQFYCNPRIPYQPDLVLDIKLYGQRK